MANNNTTRRLGRQEHPPEARDQQIQAERGTYSATPPGHSGHDAAMGTSHGGGGGDDDDEYLRGHHCFMSDSEDDSGSENNEYSSPHLRTLYTPSPSTGRSTSSGNAPSSLSS